MTPIQLIFFRIQYCGDCRHQSFESLSQSFISIYLHKFRLFKNLYRIDILQTTNINYLITIAAVGHHHVHLAAGHHHLPAGHHSHLSAVHHHHSQLIPVPGHHGGGVHGPVTSHMHAPPHHGQAGHVHGIRYPPPQRGQKSVI